MKRFAYLFSLTTAVFFLAFTLFTGCEGPAGPPGQDGANGADGLDGIDANETCKVCHNDESDLLVKQIQAGASGHMTGSAFERSDADCAACHTHEGFIDRMERGEMEASSAIADPSPPNCRTCHKVHETYTEADYAISYPGKVKLWINDVEVDYGNANVCANCHQPRIPSPMFAASGDSVTITSSRYGPHHGPQSAMVWGTGAFEVSGSEAYPTAGSSQHAGAGCSQCHMPDAYGNQAGGHTFNMTYVYHGDDAVWSAGCTDCHSASEIHDDIEALQTEVHELLETLHYALIDEGVMDSAGYTITPARVTPAMAGYIYNFKFVEEDISMGVHNPRYAKALLTNTIEAMQ